MDENQTPTQTQTQTPTESLMTLEKLILSYLNKIENHQEQLKKYKEMINSALENDDEYKERAKEAKEATQAKTAVKLQILGAPELSKINENLKDGQRQLKEMRASLSQYLYDYGQLSGTNQFEDEDGQVREIVYVAKVIKRGGGGFNRP